MSNASGNASSTVKDRIDATEAPDFNPDDQTPQPGPDSGSLYQTPRWRTLMFRGATRACPACGKRGLFGWKVTIVEDCPRCGLHFERIEGHWIGAIGMNTIFSFFMIMLTLIVGLVSTFPDFPVKELVLFSVAVAIIHPILFQPTAQTLWSAVDMLMRKLEPNEVDWRFVSRKPIRKRQKSTS
jgi:uncharacterized protein (DUF983 family)